MVGQYTLSAQAYWLQEVLCGVKEYNENMRMFFEDGTQCGDMNYVDVYNMTMKLATNNNLKPASLTYDQVHWNMEVNLLKTQLLLSAFDRSGTKMAQTQK